MPLSSIKAFYYKSTERSEDREKLADVGVSPHVCTLSLSLHVQKAEFFAKASGRNRFNIYELLQYL